MRYSLTKGLDYLFKVRQERVPAPSCAPESFPSIILFSGTAQKKHGIDGRTASYDCARRDEVGAAIEVWLWDTEQTRPEVWDGEVLAWDKNTRLSLIKGTKFKDKDGC